MSVDTERLYGPHQYQTADAYRIGYATSQIVFTIEALEHLAASGLLDDSDGDEWARSFDLSRARSDLATQLRGLRVTLDVLDPTGTSPCRERLAGAA